jgi:PhoPQ-activated pathogenicity-related protein
MVIDMLNMREQTDHQLATWGDYSYKIEDYTRRGLQKRMNTEGGESLRSIVDPYNYRDRLKQPKLIILGTNDHYWPLDALNLYWDGLNGDKHILYVPNNGHGLTDYPRLVASLAALHAQAAGGPALPKLDWQFERGDGKLLLRVKSDQPPRRVAMWSASSASRDFREARWTSSASRQDGEAHVCELAAPQSGFAAMFAEAVYDGEKGPIFLSTNVRILEPQAAE